MFASMTRIVPGRVGAERHPAQVQAVVGDRQAVAARRRRAGSPRHAEVAETQPVVVRVLQRVEPVRARCWKCSFSSVGQVGDQDRRLAVDEADQADGPAGDGVGDEQLLAVDDVIVAVEHGAWSAAPSGRNRRPARSRANADSRSPLASSRQEALLLLGRAEGPHAGRPRRCSRGPRPGRRPWRRSSPSASGTGRSGERGPRPAVFLFDQQPPIPDFRQILQRRGR